MRRALLVCTLLLVAAGSVTPPPVDAAIALRAAASGGAPGPGTITFRNSAQAGAGSGILTLTISVPVGTIQNDVMVASIGVRPYTATITAPAGWTLVRRIDSTTDATSSLAVYYRVAGSTEPPSYSWTFSTSTGSAGGIMTFSGVDTGTVVNSEAGQATAKALSHDTPSITTSAANVMLVASYTFTSSATWVSASGMTEAVDVMSQAPGSRGQSLAAYYLEQGPIGATGAKTATASNDADSGSAHLLALRPAPQFTLTINRPAGTLENDVMVASIGFRPETLVIVPPSGWTLVRRIDNANPTQNGLAVYRKVAGASEPADYTWTAAPAGQLVGGILAFSGVDTASPVDVENGQNTLSGLTHATPSVTTTVANAMLVTSHTYSSGGTWTPPTGMTEAVDVAAGLQAIEVNYVLQAAAGATGTKTATASTDADVGNTHILALRPYACPAVSEAAYLSATAQSGQATLYWSSGNPVVILRKTAAWAGEAPADGQEYSVNDTIGAATVVFVGTGAETSLVQSSLTNGTTYYYKVFAKSGTGGTACYSAGTEVNAAPAAGPHPAWSYMMAGGSMLRPGIAGSGTIYTSSNASRLVSLDTATGLQSWTPVATNAAVQGWLTWLPVGLGVVRSVQSGTATMPVGSTGAAETVTVGAAQGFAGVTDLTRSVLFFSLRGSSNQPGDGQVRGRLASTSTIEFNRANDTSLSALTIRWYVVEFYSAASVQRGTLTATNTSSVTISAVDPAKSFVLVSCAVATGDTTYGSDDYFRARLTSATNLEVVHSTTRAKTCDWQVVEYAGASVQRGEGTLGSTASTTGPIAISAVDTAASFVHVTWRSSGNGTGANFLRARLTGSSTIEIDRSVTGTTIDYAWEVVTFTDGTTVRSGTEGFTSSELTGTDPVSPAVDLTRSVAFATAYQRGGMHAYTADDNVGPGWVTVAITDSTTVTLQREITGSVAANVAWVVIEFPRAATTPTVIGGDQSGRVYSVHTGSGLANWTATLTGADAVQAAVSAQVWDWGDAAFQAAYSDHVIFAATRNASTTNNKLFALRATDGSVLWTFNGSGAYQVDYIVGQPWVDYLRNRVYVASRAGASGTQPSLWVINSLDGTLVQSFALGHLETSPTQSYDFNTLWVGNTNGDLYAIDLQTLALKWTGPVALGAAATVKGFVMEDWAAYGRLYFATADGNVRCLQDPGPGAPPSPATPCSGWAAATTAVPGPSTPLLVDALYVGSTNGSVYAIDPATGAVTKTFTVGDGTRPVGDVSTEEGTEIFVGTTEGKLYKLPLPLP